MLIGSHPCNISPGLIVIFNVLDFDSSDHGSSSDMSEYGSDDELEESSKYNGKASAPQPSSHGNLGSQPVGSRPARAAGGVDSDLSPDTSGTGGYLGLQQYMELMDRELAGTAVGQSFEKVPSSQVSGLLQNFRQA